jgi:hypothetical protein
MTSVPARQPPQDQGDAATTGTDSTENGARSVAIAVQAFLAANQANADDATKYISAPPSESGGGNDGCAVISPVQDSQDHDTELIFHQYIDVPFYWMKLLLMELTLTSLVKMARYQSKYLSILAYSATLPPLVH